MRTDEGIPFPAEINKLSLSNFGHFVTPFEDLQLALSLLKMKMMSLDLDLLMIRCFPSHTPIMLRINLPPPNFALLTKMPGTNTGVPILLKSMEPVC